MDEIKLEQNKKYLMGCSICLLFLSAWGVVQMIIDLMFKENREKLQAAWAAFPPAVAIGATAAFVLITLLCYLYLGIKAYKQTQDDVKGYGHILLAKILLVLSAIMSVATIVQFVQKTADFSDMIRSVTSTAFLVFYVVSSSYLKAHK